MARHITVLPASTKAGEWTIRHLLAADSKPHVRAVYRDPSKAPAEFTSDPNFEAVTGDVGIESSLDFTGSDAVFYIPPPIYDGTDTGDWATRTATHVKKALQKTPGVKKLLLFSSIGAQHERGIGILRLNHISDEILKGAVPEVRIVRPGYFLEMLASLLNVKSDPPVLDFFATPVDHGTPMVSLHDISRTCADALLSSEVKTPSPHIIKIFGPQHYSALDLQRAAEQATGKKVVLNAIPRAQLADWYGRVEKVPEPYVQELVEMTTSVMPGGPIFGDLEYAEDAVRGKVEAVDVLRELFAGKTTAGKV